MPRSTASRGIRIAVVSGAAVLCAGAAVPAMAHDTATVRSQGDEQQLSFAQQQQLAMLNLDREASWLSALRAKVASDPRLTADQKAAFTAKLDAALNAVATARAAVGAASSPAQLQAALRTAELPYLAYPRQLMRPHGRHGDHRAGRFAAHRGFRGESTDHGSRDAVALAGKHFARPMEVHRSVTVHRAVDPWWQRDGRDGGPCDHSGYRDHTGSGDWRDGGDTGGHHRDGGGTGGSWD